jgi:Fic family protein
MREELKNQVIMTLSSHSSNGLTRGELFDIIKENFPKPFSHKTLQRLLKDMSEKEGLLEITGHTKGTRYFLKDKAQAEQLKENLSTSGEKNISRPIADKAMQNTTSSIFSKNSLDRLMEIRRPTFERKPVPYRRDFLSSYIPNETYYLGPSIREELLSLGKKVRGGGHLPAGTYTRKILERFLIDLSFNSSRLEGNTYSLLDTEKLIRHGEGSTLKSIEERTMILNHKEAIEFIVGLGENNSLSPFIIKNIHYAITQDLLANPESSGAVRNTPVNIGKSVYTPSAIPQVLEECLSLISNKAKKIVDPFERSFFLLVHLSYLQAFEDGNKRTARLTSNVPLIEANLCPNSFSDISRNDYNQAILVAYEKNDVKPFAEVFSYCYKRSAIRYDVVIETTAAPDEFRIHYRHKRKELIGEIIRNSVKKEGLEDFIDNFISQQNIVKKDQDLFKVHVLEDLEKLNEGRIIGLGVSEAQYKAWKAIYE